MPRKPKAPPVVCEYFVWRLFRCNGVYYADGRGGKHKLGKHSLGTRDRDEARDQLRALDLHMAIKLGLAKPDATKPSVAVNISDGWRMYMDYCSGSPVMRGVSPGTKKRYRAVRDKHAKFCARHGITCRLSVRDEDDKRQLGRRCSGYRYGFPGGFPPRRSGLSQSLGQTQDVLRKFF